MFQKIIYAYNAVRRYIFRDTKYLFLYIYRYFQNNYRNDCKFYTEEDLTNLIRSGKSILRLGDGEISLLHFLPPPNNVQEYSDEIRNDFLKIIKNYNANSNYILAIPLFVNYTNTELKKANRFTHFRQLKITYELIFNKSAKYFDAHTFYKDGNFEKIILPYMKTKKTVLVTNKELGAIIAKAEPPSNDFFYVTCTDHHAYENRLQIQNDVINLIKKTGLPKDNFVIILCSGLAKTIVYDMSNDGYQVIDIGNGLKSYYLKKSIENLI
jgi:hypothetical protein